MPEEVPAHPLAVFLRGERSVRDDALRGGRSSLSGHSPRALSEGILIDLSAVLFGGDESGYGVSADVESEAVSGDAFGHGGLDAVVGAHRGGEFGGLVAGGGGAGGGVDQLDGASAVQRGALHEDGVGGGDGERLAAGGALQASHGEGADGGQGGLCQVAGGVGGDGYLLHAVGACGGVEGDVVVVLLEQRVVGDEALRAYLQAFVGAAGVYPGEGALADVLAVSQVAGGDAEAEGGCDGAQGFFVGGVEGHLVEAGVDAGDAGGGFHELQGAEVADGVAVFVERIVADDGVGELCDGGVVGDFEVAQGDVGVGVRACALRGDGGQGAFAYLVGCGDAVACGGLGAGQEDGAR